MRSTAVNQLSQASGIFQCMPINLPGLGFGSVPGTLLEDYKAAVAKGAKITDELRAWLYWNAEQFRAIGNGGQVPFAMRFYRSKRGRLTSAMACYVATFLPKFMAHADDAAYVLCGVARGNPDLSAAENTRFYQANRSFDADTKGWIEVGDLARVTEKVDGVRWRELLKRIDGIDGGGGPGAGEGTSFVSVANFDAAGKAVAATSVFGALVVFGALALAVSMLPPRVFA